MAEPTDKCTEDKIDTLYEKKAIEILREKLDFYKNIRGYMILSKNGDCKYTTFEYAEKGETLAIMTATIFGAANTANSELHKNPADIVKIESDDEVTMIVPIKGLLLCLDVHKQNLETVISDMQTISKQQ